METFHTEHQKRDSPAPLKQIPRSTGSICRTLPTRSYLAMSRSKQILAHFAAFQLASITAIYPDRSAPKPSPTTTFNLVAYFDSDPSSNPIHFAVLKIASIQRHTALIIRVKTEPFFFWRFWTLSKLICAFFVLPDVTSPTLISKNSFKNLTKKCAFSEFLDLTLVIRLR